MVVNIIGPFNVTPSHLEDDNTYADGTEEFRVLTPHNQALQLQGLASKTNRADYGNTSVVSAQRSGWGLIPVDTSTPLVTNEDWTHRGYYVINTVEPEVQKGAVMQSKITAEKIANPSDYLTMNYTPGYNDGTVQSFNYTADTVTATVFEDTCNVHAYTDYWCTKSDYSAASSIATTSGKYVFGVQASSWAVWGGTLITSLASYTPPFTVEFDLEWVAYATSYDQFFSLYITNGTPLIWGDLNSGCAANTYYFQIFLRMESSQTTYGIWRCAAGNSGDLIARPVLAVGEKTPRFKVEWLPGGIATVYVDEAGGSTWTKLWGPAPTGLTFNDLTFAIGLNTRDNATANYAKINNFLIYQNVGTANNNVVPLPAGSDFVDASSPADVYRLSDEGNIPCHVNPGDDLPFSLTTPSSYYKGSVKAYNSYYTGSTPYPVTRSDEVLSPTKFYVKNGLLKLTTNASASTPIVLSYCVSPNYTDIQYLGLEGLALTTMKPLYISPERHTYQLNDTRWTVWRGKPFVKIEHPNTDVTYTRTTYYVHDGATITSPAANADVTMAATPYCNIYANSGDTYRFQILQLDPTTIKSDKIPATAQSGIGWYNNTAASPSYDWYVNIAKEFRVQPLTAIGVKTL